MSTGIPLRLRFYVVSAVSGSRLPLAAIFVYTALDPNLFIRKWSFLILLLILASDFCDGLLARRWKVVSRLGFVLDGLGDRAGYIACLLVLSARLGLPILMTYLIILRDIVLYAARSLHPEWASTIDQTRWLAKIHAGMLRLIFLLYFLPFYVQLFGMEYPSLISLSSLELQVLVAIYMVLSYISLWLVLHSYALGRYKFLQNPESDWE